MIDKIFSDNFGKVTKKIRSTPSLKDDYFSYIKILQEKYPAYYERKYSNSKYRYDNKYFWMSEKNDRISEIPQIDFGELYSREYVKFDGIFEDSKNNENNNNLSFNEIKEE